MKYLLEGEETERLRFRRLLQSDYDAWMYMFSNVETGRFLGMGHIKTAQEQCDNWFTRSFKRYEDRLGGMNVLVDKHTNNLVGQCGLLIQEVDGETLMEVGYSILPQQWKKGYATEAAVKCRNYAFENDYADAIISIIHTENEGSKRVAANNGMKLWKETIYKEMPVHVFRITREEWEQLNK